MKYILALPVLLAVLLGIAIPGEAHRHFHRHFVPRSRVFVGTTVFVGPGFWGPPWPYWRDPYWYPAYAPPVMIREEPQVYVQQQPAPPPPQPQQYSWYYCPDTKTYYPYVQQCPSGWLKVVPQTAPPQQ